MQEPIHARAESAEGPIVFTHSLRIEATRYYAVLPVSPEQRPKAILLALHGWGQNAPRFIRQFASLSERGILVVAPQGPHQFYLDVASKKVGFNWLTVYEKARNIQDVNVFLQGVLEETGKQGDACALPVFVFGFSQGVSMAYRFAASDLSPISGLIACCSDIPPDVVEILPQLSPFPVLLGHGKEDPLIPLSKAEEAREHLARHAFPCELHPYDGGHQIPRPFVGYVGGWIEAGIR